MGKGNLPEGDRRFEFNVGLDGFQWGGVYTEGSPARNPVHRPRALINARLQGGEIVERDGLTKFNSSPFHNASACVRHIDNFQGEPLKLWMTGDGCPDISSSSGRHVSAIDQEQDPEFQRVVYYDSASQSAVVARFDGHIYVGVDSDLRVLTLIIPEPGTEALTVGGSSQDRVVFSFTTAAGYDDDYTIRCMLEFDGKLFIGLDTGTGVSKIVTWDGVSIRDDKTTIDAPTCFGLYHVPSGGDCIVAGFDSVTNGIKYRATGDSPGTWTDVSPGAGTLGALSMAAYKDVLYIADDSGDVWSWDGTTLQSAHSPGSATACRAVTVFNALLYFGYETAASARIGKYDGSTWTDVEKNLTTQFSGTTSIHALKPYRNSLYAGVIRSGAGQVMFSPETTTSGSWTTALSNASTGDISSLMVA